MENIQTILIASITPYFLEKEVFWFQENLEEILQSLKTQSFFQDNVVFLQQGQNYNISEFLRKLDDMGYEKVFDVGEPGEFSQKGGVIEVFPINRLEAVRLDFLGNTIESIELLDIKITDEKKSKEILHKKLKSQTLFSDLKNLKEGEYLVHLDHGVGRYTGIQELAGEQCHVLEYAQKDTLFVPVQLERKLSRYVGFSEPVLARLGSALWQKTKKAIKENVEKLAKELLALYAEKETMTRQPYIMDRELESQLASGFAYQETPDQLKAIEDIKNDLEKEKPMDRIVCGDVGFGKTEVAMRASLMAASNNYQVAVICPTTILASQHAENFKKRFAKLPVKIALLSRLQTKAEQKKILHDIKNGAVDIVIGTHRILSSDVEFKKLQLLILDDEQRFGVKQKEKLRHKNPAVDMLSLSATPIPRTIYLALSSFKNISLMQTPPKGRTAIEMNVLPYSKRIIKEAIEFELARDGQVYFLHNRVSTIEKIKMDLQVLIPDTRIGVIHGRVDEKQLVKTMDEFSNRKTQILVATTIIENGIDLPNVNTIIVEDGTKLGLAQAYQIKGRVGRGQTQSFAYLFYKPKFLTPIAKERLNALQEAKELGSGYKIAIKDLELRGAGNILGKEQSGSINKIGLNLYCQILAEAVEKMRG
ncbi:DEAD/DEAH box helicase [Candidatus Parcubacteria bacterium]|nr:DEAD/DEAH box helicase [Candidatus Parcubacteria bacterium]